MTEGRHCTHLQKRARIIQGTTGLTFVLGEVTEQVLLEAIFWQMKEKSETGNSQDRFTQGKPWLTNLSFTMNSSDLWLRGE